MEITYDALGVLSIVNDAPEYFAIGTTAVTWTATDVVANTAAFIQYVHLVDRDITCTVRYH